MSSPTPSPSGYPQTFTLGPIVHHLNVTFPADFRVYHRLELDPAIVSLLNRYIALLENPMTAQEFKDYLDVKVNEFKAQAATEHDQVMAAIQAASDQVSDQVPDSVKPLIDSTFDTLTGAVQGIFDGGPPTQPPVAPPIGPV